MRKKKHQELKKTEEITRGKGSVSPEELLKGIIDSVVHHHFCKS
jgi:hypothetical protein